jgi:hypothetical protein
MQALEFTNIPSSHAAVVADRAQLVDIPWEQS